MKSGIQIGIGHMLQSNCFEDAVDIWHTSGLIKSLLEKISKSDLLKHSKFQADIGMTDYVSLIPLHEFLGMDLDMYTFINEEIIMADISFPIDKAMDETGVVDTAEEYLKKNKDNKSE